MATACSSKDDISPVAEDVLFLVLGKMSIYIQDLNGGHTLRDHHFVAEIMPNETGEILRGKLTSADNPNLNIPFNPEGRQFLAHGERVIVAEELHQRHPDGTYLFSYKTRSGEMKNQPLTLKRRDTTDVMPQPATLGLSQNANIISAVEVNPEADLTVSWTPMKGNMKSPNSELADLIFVLGFDCFGNNIAHSGRPYQGTPYLTYEDSSFTIPADDLKPGITYSLIVEQATADVETFQGVPGITTYATLTFLDAQTIGEANDDGKCPTN
mgnify:CR=1 FL=1